MTIVIWLTIGFLLVVYLNATTYRPHCLAYFAAVLGLLLLPFVARRWVGRWILKATAHF